jgi:Cu(I)/Ag(I) efflux system membrane fusion protein
MNMKRLGIAIVGAALAFALGLMIGGSADHGHKAHAAAGSEDGGLWTCSMHPQIQKTEPGDCPICGMDLIPLKAGADDTGPRELKLSEAARKLADIEVQPVRRQAVEREVRMVGSIDYDERRLATITAWVGGRLDKIYVDYTGVTVKKGDHMVWMYSPEILAAEEELVQARRAVDKMAGNGSTLIRNSAVATLEASRDKLRLWGLTAEQITAIESGGKAEDHIQINAPIGGVVIHKNAEEGMYVKTGTPIYRIADLSQVWAKLDAYESDLAWIRYGQEVSFETEAYPGEVFRGRVSFIDPVLTGATRTVKVRVNVANPARKLKPGLFVRAVLRSAVATGGKVIDADLAGKWISPMHPEIVRDEPGNCDICGMDLVRSEELGFVSSADAAIGAPLVIPASAPLLTGTRAVVYVRASNDPGRFAGRTVTLGPRVGDFYVVEAGLEEGELVVTEGNFKIDSALQILAKPSMMSAAPPIDSKLIEQYLLIQEALAADQLEPALSAAKAMDHPAAKAIADSADIAAARQQFYLLSKALIPSARGAQIPLKLIHCSMAFDDTGASWLQRDGKTANPYFGDEMLRCGKVEERIGGPPPAPTGHEHHGH